MSKIIPIMSLAEEGPACPFPASLLASETSASREASGRQGQRCQEHRHSGQTDSGSDLDWCVDISAQSLGLLICKQGFQRQAQWACETG